MGRAHVRCIVVLALLVLTGCDKPRSPVAPQPLPEPAAPQVMPAIRGLVRETNGGSIAGARVRMSPGGPEAISDASGVFHFPSSPCDQPSKYFVVGSLAQWFPEPAGKLPTCVSASNASEVTVELKGQARLSVSRDTPLQTFLSDDDVSWINPEGYSCGPCKMILLDPPLLAPLELRVDWSTDDPLKVWIEGDDFFESVRLVDLLAPAGERGVSILFPPEWSRFDGYAVKVGRASCAAPLPKALARR